MYILRQKEEGRGDLLPYLTKKNKIFKEKNFDTNTMKEELFNKAKLIN